MVSSDHFRQVMGNLATGISVVTTRVAGGEPYGLTVNALTSVSLNPPLVLVCLDNRLSGLESFKSAKHFGVSILSEHQEDISRIFAKKDSDRPESIYFQGALGMPLLKSSLAVMECEIAAVHPAGDHQIFVGEVKALEIFEPNHPLMYFRGKYRKMSIEGQ